MAPFLAFVLRCTVAILILWHLSCDGTFGPSQTPAQVGTAPSATRQPRIETQHPTERITFTDLDCTIQPDIVFREWMLPDRVRRLDGRRVRIGGYLLPGAQQNVIREFVLVKNTECKFGPGGQADHLILVKLKPGLTTTYTVTPIDVEGVLHFKPYLGPDGNTWGIYEMQGESVSPMRR